MMWFFLHLFLCLNKEIITPDYSQNPEEDQILAIGSGGNYALSAARALVENTDLSAREIVEKSLKIAGDICVYTNTNFTIEELPANQEGK